MANIVTAHKVMAYMVMACAIMAYVVMAYDFFFTHENAPQPWPWPLMAHIVMARTASCTNSVHGGM